MEYIVFLLKLIFFAAFIFVAVPKCSIKDLTLFEFFLSLFMIEIIIASILREDLFFFFLVSIVSVAIMRWKLIWVRDRNAENLFWHVYPKIHRNQPVPIIVNGVFEEKNLEMLHKDKIWVEEVLTKEHIELHKVYYAFYFNRNMHIIVY